MFQVVTHWSARRLVPPQLKKGSKRKVSFTLLDVASLPFETCTHNMIVAVQLLAGVRGSIAVAPEAG
jgi:hypothetical protein